jgi:flagellar motility protein MotE (MotC chaperone)
LPKEEGQTTQLPKEEGQTTQLPKEEGQTTQLPKEKRTNTIYKALHRKLKIQQRESHYNRDELLFKYSEG